MRPRAALRRAGRWSLDWAALSLIVTPSLAFMAEAASAAGLGSHGVAYGVYNVAWAVGLMGGPSLGGFLFEHIGFGALTVAGWAVVLLVVAAVLAEDPTEGLAGCARNFTELRDPARGTRVRCSRSEAVRSDTNARAEGHERPTGNRRQPVVHEVPVHRSASGGRGDR